MELHPVGNPGMPAQHEQNNSEQDRQDGQAEVDPPTGILAQAITEPQRTHRESVPVGSAAHQRQKKYIASLSTSRDRLLC